MGWITSTEAAHQLGISDRTLRRRLRAGMYPHRRAGRSVLIELPDNPVDGRELVHVGAAAMRPGGHADVLATIVANHRADLQVMRTVNRTSVIVGCFATAGMTVIAAALAVGYDARRSELSELTVGHVRQVVGLERERDAARTAAASAKQDADEARSAFASLLIGEPVVSAARE